MPFLALVHLRDLKCPVCGVPLAVAGARSFIVDSHGDPYDFPADRIPEAMLVRLTCANGHPNELAAPRDISAEETRVTPDDAPIGADAIKLAEGDP